MKVKLPLHEFETTKEDYNFLQKIVENQLFKYIGENLSYWRWNNVLRMSEKVKDKCEKLGYEPKKVSPKFLNQFLEGVSLEDNDSLQEIWSEIYLRESEEGDSYSLRTLNVLKMMSHEEAILFFEVCPFFAEINGEMFLLEFPILFEKYSLTYE